MMLYGCQMGGIGMEHNRIDIDVRRLCGKCGNASSLKREHKGGKQTCATCGKDPAPYNVFTPAAGELEAMLADERRRVFR